MSYFDEGLETLGYYGNWAYVVVSTILFGFFIAFMPLHRKTHRRPASIYLAFIFSSAFEMYGIPLSLYFVAWAFGVHLPEGLMWGHTLKQYVGHLGIYLGLAINLVGADLVIRGWGSVHKNYWGKKKGERKLVTDGIYSYMRHPQYTGFMLLTLGLIVHWATIPLLIMWPVLAYQYYKLAKKEEGEMIEEFGKEYVEYQKRTPMFIPRLKKGSGNVQ